MDEASIADREVEVAKDKKVKFTVIPAENYIQLYIPFDYFEKACKMIKSVYSESNGYIGYTNYMKYWARNGDYNWICNKSEYPDGPTSGKTEVAKTYVVTNFWNNYNGTQSPVDGGKTNVDGKGGTTAVGWRKQDLNK